MTDEELIARLGEIQGQAGLFASAAAARIEQLVATNEALTKELAAARQDADEAEAYAWQLEQQLGKAVETLKVALRYNNAMHGGAGAYNKRIKDFIAELKGHDDE